MAIEKVEVHMYANPTTYIRKETGKIVGGRVLFHSADPARPVVWLNQPGYSIQNQKTKKRMLFYDTTTKMLIKPNTLGGASGTVDDMSVAVQQVLAAEGDTGKELGISETNKYWGLLGLAAFALGIIGVVLMFALAAPHTAASSSSPGSSSVLGLGVITTTIPASSASRSSASNATVHIT